MRLEQLQSFLSVAETGSFQQAARKCGVTQSTISRQVQGLEEELGLPLFHRTTQAKLTIGGERFWPYARKICQTWDSAKEELASLLAGKQPELCVAAIHSVCSSYLPPVLQKFCYAHPEVQLRVTSLGSDRALKVLKDGLVDIAIIMNNRSFTASAELLVDILYQEPIELLMASSHPLTQYSQVPWHELIRYPQVVFKDGYGMQRFVQEKFTQAGAKLNAVLELNTLDGFRGVIRQGELIALLPYSALIEARTDPTLAVRGLAPIPFGHPKTSLASSASSALIPTNGDTTWTREVVIVTTPDRMQIPPIAYFWQLVHDYIDRSIDSLNPQTPLLK
ncbi:putative nitrogen assimilation transcriptional activator [Planktothrix serta PCC 8927]|uniref:Nitrogen assimilation transcriptional activator n=1 Tax=Planktothrix serta PCC 8927 TaxID=671068 RepID=A0A7Z9C452_9CYAN|nr:LysR family transcriptional regulator [Planktothrix serta]VXD25564.1 putative nitrogen assimilation transcriptional activator [Planktothrix serta PCC 8927]